jgi:hypothetical protein
LPDVTRRASPRRCRRGRQARATSRPRPTPTRRPRRRSEPAIRCASRLTASLRPWSASSCSARCCSPRSRASSCSGFVR